MSHNPFDPPPGTVLHEDPAYDISITTDGIGYHGTIESAWQIEGGGDPDDRVVWEGYGAIEDVAAGIARYFEASDADMRAAIERLADALVMTQALGIEPTMLQVAERLRAIAARGRLAD